MQPENIMCHPDMAGDSQTHSYMPQGLLLHVYALSPQIIFASRLPDEAHLSAMSEKNNKKTKKNKKKKQKFKYYFRWVSIKQSSSNQWYVNRIKKCKLSQLMDYGTYHIGDQ